MPALENFGSTSAIKVGRQEISARDVELEIRNQMRAIQEQNPGVSREQALAQGLGGQVVQTMITRALLEDEAASLGLAAPGPVVQDYIGTIEGLTDPDTGRVDQQALSFFLSQNGLSLQGFRDLLAGELVRQQVAEAITQPIGAPNEMTRLLLLRGVERRQVRFATIPLDAAATEPTEDEIEAYYNTNISRFQSPEYRVLTFVSVDDSDVAETIEVSEEDIQQLFNARQGAAAASETRTVRQLRLGADDVEEAQRLVDEGATLDAVSEAVGGTITTLENQGRGAFINDALVEAAFAAEEGAVAGPVETPFGTVFLSVTDIARTEGPSFEDEREALEAELRAEIAADRVSELVEAVELARDEGATLNEAADTAGLNARQTQPLDQELFTRTGAIASIPASLAREGFSLLEGDESSAIPVGTGYGFVTVDQIIAPSPLALSEVRDDVVGALKVQRRQSAAETIETQFEEAIVS
ncbi:MAG: peptidyl-prolyl cis-trans isomerase, partial [Planctomycetota bacterium]